MRFFSHIFEKPRVKPFVGRLARFSLVWFITLSAHAQDSSIESDVSGYLFVTGWYKDLGVQSHYTKLMSEIIYRYGYQSRVIGIPSVNLQVIEGDWAPRLMVIAKFPSTDSVKRFWWSDDYREVVNSRSSNAYLDVVAVRGIDGVHARMDGNAAYLVFFAKVTDMASFASRYARHAPEVVSAYGGQFIIHSDRSDIDMLEGDWLNASLVVLEFPSAESLTKFWNSDEYRSLSEVRRKTGKWSVVSIMP